MDYEALDMQQLHKFSKTIRLFISYDLAYFLKPAFNKLLLQNLFNR